MMMHKNKKQDEELESVKELLGNKETEMNDLDSVEDIKEIDLHKIPMTDAEVVSFCKNEISRGIGGPSHGDNSSEQVALSYDYFFGRKPGLSKAAARDLKASRYVSLDLQDAVESTVAEIMPTFQTNELAFYTPEEERDEAAAQAESDIVNYLFIHEYDGFTLLETCLKDALLNRNASTSVHWDKSTKVTYETIENIPAIQLESVIEPQVEKQTVEVIEQDSEIISSPVLNPSGQPVLDESGMPIMQEMEVFEIKIKRMTVVEKPVIESILPEQLIVAGDHDSPILYNARFIAHENVVTQSYLIERGVPESVVDELPDYNTSTEEQSRARTAAEFDYGSSDRSVRLIRVYVCYAFLDIDRDGIAERVKVLISGSTLLEITPIESYDIVGGAVSTIAHKYKGLSLFDKLKDIQDAKTPVMRSIIDGTQLSSNPRTGVLTGKVNMDDLITSRTGGIVRMERTDAIVPLPSGEVPQSSYSFLSLMDSVRRERGGAAIDTASTAQSMENSSENTVGRVMNAMEMLNAHLAKTFGETLVKGIFVQMHQILRENHKGKLSAKIRGKWVTGIPSQWKDRTGVTITVGMSSSERQRQKNAMGEIIQTQGMLKETGSLMFSESKLYQSLVKSAALSGIKNPETYYIDPESEEGQQASKAQSEQSQKAQQEQMELQAAMAKAQDDIAQAELMKGQASMIAQQVKAENDMLKNQLTEMKQMLDANAKSIDQQLKDKELDNKEAIELTKLEMEHQQELNKKNEENKQNGNG